MHLLQFYADSLETSQMFRSLSEDVHIVIPAFFFRKKGILISVKVGLSSVRAYICLSRFL